MAQATASSRLAAAFVALACISSVRPAAADASAADRALAQSLFDDARKLMDDKDYAHACPKFAESERLDPGGGTLLNLALCHEAEGRTATAWTEFNEALSRAIRDGRPEREARARERIAVLQPSLSRLTVSVAGEAPGLELTVDGASWGAPLRGVGVPVDPGPHVIVAKATGRTTWSATVTLSPNADAKTVVVPTLESPTPTPSAAARSSFAAAPHDDTAATGVDGRRTAGWIVGGAGVAALGVGTFFGFRALSKRSDSDAHCQPACTQQGVDANDQAITAAWIADAAIGLGVVSVAAAAYLLVTSRGATRSQATTSTVRLLPHASARGGGAALTVRW